MRHRAPSDDEATFPLTETPGDSVGEALRFVNRACRYIRRAYRFANRALRDIERAFRFVKPGVPLHQEAFRVVTQVC